MSLLATAERDRPGDPDGAAETRHDAVSLILYAALPLLVLVVYLNLSSVLVERISIPSILQPLILVLILLVVLYRDALHPLAALLRPATVALVAYCLVVFVSSNWASDIAVADHELSDLLKSVMLLALVAGLTASWRALRGALLALVAGAVILSVLTLAQVAIGDASVDFGGLAEIEEAHLAGDFSTLRPAGPVGDPNYFARILLLAFPAAAFLGVGRTRTIQALFLAATGAIVMAILVTYSRGGMLSLAAVGCLLVAVGRIRISSITVAIGVAALIALIPTQVGQRLLTIEDIFSEKSADVTDTSSYKRKQLLATGWRMFDDHPIMGVGVGNFGSHYATYANLVGFELSDYTPLGVRQYAHNLYLEIAAETGLLGLLSFLAAMGVVLASLFRSRRTLLDRGEPERAALVTALALAIAGYLLSSVFLHHTGVHRYLWLILGFAVASLRLTEDGGIVEPSDSRTGQSAARATRVS